MSTLLYSPTDPAVIDLGIEIDPADLVGSDYNRIEVLRSKLGEGGPFTLLTAADTPKGALLPLGASSFTGAGPTYNVAGLDIQLLLNDATPLSYTFTGSDPLSSVEVVSQLNTTFSGVLTAYVDENGKLCLITVATGGTVKLQAVGGEATTLLGLSTTSPDNTAYGTAARITLVSGQVRYSFRDYYGLDTYHYVTRFYSTVSLTHGAMSTPFSPSDYLTIASANLTRGFVKLVDGVGRPARGAKVSVYHPFNSTRVGGYAVIGGAHEIVTDKNGYASIMLVRGVAIDVSVSGTDLMRRVVVPTDTAITAFDLLNPDYGNDDGFAVQRIDVPYAERRGI